MIILAFIALCIFPGASVNSQIAKLIICAACLLIANPKGGFEGRLPWTMFCAWLIWAAIGCYQSEWVQIAIFGYHQRCEGLLTYLLFTGLAYYWWKQTFFPGAVLVFVMVFLCVLFPLLHLTIRDASLPGTLMGWLAVPAVAQGGLFSIAGVILYAQSRGLVLLAMPAILYSGCRSAIFAVLIGMAVCEVFGKPIKTAINRQKACYMGILALLIGLVSLYTPLGQKLVKTRLNGLGSRSQWIIQAEILSKRLSITGLGLDTGSKWLKPAQGIQFYDAGFQATSDHQPVISDKTHNIGYDILLQTGWIGLTLLLMCFGVAIHHVLNYRTVLNVTCLSGLSAFIAYGMINPVGCPGIALALILLAGIKGTK